MAVRIYKLSELSNQQLADAISEYVTDFDTVTVDGNTVKISDADGNLVLSIESYYGRFYTLDGTNLVTNNAYFRDQGYIGVCSNGIVVYTGNSKYALSKSQHGEYAFMSTGDSGSTTTCVSQSSITSKEYSFGGTLDVQTLLTFFPLATGSYSYDCTNKAFIAQVYQSNDYYGLTVFEGKEYLQAGRFFILDKENAG